MNIDDLMDWLKAHNDALIITDFKEHNIPGLTHIRDIYPEYVPRIIPQIYYPYEYPAVEKMGYNKIILTLYRSSMNDNTVVNFVKRYRSLRVTMPVKRVFESTLASRLKSRGIFVYAHTVNKKTVREALFNRGVQGFYTDFLTP